MDYKEFCTVWIPLGEELLATAKRILGSSQDAEDAIQDLYAKLWQLRDTLDNVYNPPGYATRLLKNICIDRIRARKTSDSLPEELQGFERTDSMIEDREEIRSVAAAIARLPKTQRTILEMRTLEDLSYEEMSERLGMSKLTIRVLLSRARAAIRKNA